MHTDRLRRRAFIALLGGAAAWPLAARTQQLQKIPTVGVLWHAGSADQEGPYYTAMLQGFDAIGYKVGQAIRLEDRFPNEITDRFKAMAAELIASKVDVLVGVGVAASLVVKNATATIPVVFTLAPDPSQLSWWIA
jgi:putative tryptophan/tyrosine transport system substrate-binding protein